MKKPQFVIAAPTSNAGKTTVTLGLLRALKNRGLNPQSFKCGPDYIDPKFHEVAGQKTGINLDLFLMTEQHLHDTYAQYTSDAGATCIEGVMGLFDGAKKSEGSTAAIAKSLNLPIILVVDAKAVAYSVAPLLYGFKNFDSSVQIGGVIFNRVNTTSHYQFLTEACEDVNIQPLGYLPYLPEGEIPSRHLGLSIDQMAQYNSIIEKFATQLEKTVDIDQLLTLCTTESLLPIKNTKPKPTKLTIAIASDEAFNFSYHQNTEALRQVGTITYFSPLHDQSVPAADLIYLPGGYPELHLEKLAQNTPMLKSMKNHAESGNALIAECGGLMYLGKSITNKEGKTYQMVNLFDFKTSMENMKLRLGYRQITHEEIILRGHEFHYSTIENDNKNQQIGQVKTARNKEIDTKIYQYKNTIASYIHLYFGTDQSLNQLLQLINLPQLHTNEKPKTENRKIS